MHCNAGNCFLLSIFPFALFHRPVILYQYPTFARVNIFNPYTLCVYFAIISTLMAFININPVISMIHNKIIKNVQVCPSILKFMLPFTNS